VMGNLRCCYSAWRTPLVILMSKAFWMLRNYCTRVLQLSEENACRGLGRFQDPENAHGPSQNRPKSWKRSQHNYWISDINGIIYWVRLPILYSACGGVRVTVLLLRLLGSTGARTLDTSFQEWSATTETTSDGFLWVLKSD